MSEGYFLTDGKIIEPWCVAEGEPIATPLFDYGDSMAKVASSLDHVPSLQDFINKAKPEKGWASLLIHAVGADEVWGGNRKADAFPLEWLVPADKTAEYGYKSFETKAMGYVHHRNTPDRWTGKVLKADYSRPMGRVELIVKFNLRRLIEEGAPYFAEMLGRGELPPVSMGCRVPYDICSICGNKAPTTRDYCTHLLHQRLAILEDGRRVRMWNFKPLFHDISLVNSPADRAARALLKIASEGNWDKNATIRKRIGPIMPLAGIRTLGKDQYEAMLATDADVKIPLNMLRKAASAPRHTFLSNLTAVGVLLRPYEYAAWELMRVGQHQKAAEIYETESDFPIYDTTADGMYFAPQEDSIGDAVDLAQGRSLYVPAFRKRTSSNSWAKGRTKSAATKVDVPEDIHYSYAAYRKSAEQALLDGSATQWLMQRPRILTRVMGHDIPIVLKQAALDEPRWVFEPLIRGGHLTENVTTVGVNHE